jgi:predicted chitinase
MNVDTLCRAMPGLNAAKANAYLGPMQRAMLEFDIKTELRSDMWLAQVGHESASLVYFEELASGSAYEGRRDLGNTQPGDGPRFKGRGPIQITGRANYTQAGAALHVDIVSNPSLAADPSVAFRLSAWWWANHGLNTIADSGDVLAATRRINGGTNGLSDRQQRYQIARSLGSAVIPSGGGGAPAPTPAPASAGAPPFPGRNLTVGMSGADVRQWQQQMKNRGWNVTVDGAFGPASADVARKFQAEKGLQADGVVGRETWAASWTSAVT